METFLMLHIQGERWPVFEAGNFLSLNNQDGQIWNGPSSTQNNSSKKTKLY